MIPVETELEKFELQAAARMWDALEPTDRATLIAALHCELSLPQHEVESTHGPISHADDGFKKRYSIEYSSRDDTVTLRKMGLIERGWASGNWVPSHRPPVEIASRLGTIVARYGEAKMLVELADGLRSPQARKMSFCGVCCIEHDENNWPHC